MKQGPLEGIKVIEVASWIAVPGAAAILGDWGADVIKVESLAGDPLRGYVSSGDIRITDIHFWFEVDNRNKKAIAVDLKKEQGREIINRLIDKADVFLTNWSSSTLRARKLDFESLAERNPRLVYMHFTGFGEDGPEKDKPGYDRTAFWTRGGFMYRLCEPGGIPPSQPLSIGDQISAMFIAGAVASGIVARDRTGKPQEVTLSLYQNAVWSLGWELQAVLSAGVEDGWRYQKRASNPLSNKYLTKDGRWIEIACLQSDRHWPDFCKSIEREDLTGDSRFNTRLARQENCEALIKVIDEAFSKRTADEWEGVLTRNGIVFEKARSFKEIAADPQATQNGFFAEVEHPSGKRMKLVNSPAKFNGVSSPIRMTAPELGQDDEEVLLELGYTWEQISDLKEQKIIL